MEEYISLAHGSGGKATNDLIGNLFRKYFENEYLTADDAAVIGTDGSALSVSTDGFIVSPWEFPGGNIGKLSICGTVNDIACMGARPKYITCSFVIEEGFPAADLEKITASRADTCAKAGVRIIAGDTKVAGKGQVDGVFITTTGIGEMIPGVKTGGALAKEGDAVIVTGDIGRHGCTILLARNDFKIKADITSDCAPLGKNIEAVLDVTKDVHVIRDATRGGVGTVLYEIAEQSSCGIEIDAESIPCGENVRGVCDLLGLEPMYLACEGRLVIIAPSGEAPGIVEALRGQENSENAAVIGRITSGNTGKVIVNTSIGTKTILPQPGGELLPRIC